MFHGRREEYVESMRIVLPENFMHVAVLRGNF